ncbi:MAG: hypothetical protein AAB443_02870, partial [Patescibacteria group bacterium]
YELYNKSWSTGSIIIATPNITLGALDALKKALRTLANAESLDLDVVVAMIIEDGTPKESTRWRLGWDDGNQLFVHLFPQEFFQLPGAECVYNEWVKIHSH